MTTSMTAQVQTGGNDGPPVISLASETVVQEIHDACSAWGAFVVTDHGLDSSLQESVLQTGHEFFRLDATIKEGYNLQKHGSKWRGYMPLGGEQSVKGKVRDYKEGLYMGDEHPVDNPHLGLPTFGSNVFPDKETPHMKALFLDYHDQMKELGNRMMRLLAQALGLPTDYLETHVTKKDPVILPRMFRYLPQEIDGENENNDGEIKDVDQQQYQWGIGEHSDYGLWTMILTDALGLEFKHPKTNKWHAIPYIPNAIIMNVGDVLDRLTSGRFVSAYPKMSSSRQVET